MSEGTKTGVFWCVAVVMLAIAAFVAWPTTSNDDTVIAGRDLFPEFKDPGVASSMKIVTFDDEQGTLDMFEVRKDRDTGAWTIPSRSGYPADAVDQMKDAANAFVSLKILDTQTSNAEDHDDLGVEEPKLEDLEIGDDGVGRLVTFKDESQKVIASLIIGDKAKDNEAQRYVRIPGQDPVYVVKLDEAPLTTTFQTWIEDDLLQMSSINIEDVEIKDYTCAPVSLREIRIDRNYDVNVGMDGSDWNLNQLMEYPTGNPLAPPVPVVVGPDEKLDATKFNAMKNALDDLKIADVKRKPDGMSAGLRANEDLFNNNEAMTSLARRGFYPLPVGAGGSYEILSANGELRVGLKDGVQYVMRFGKISGLTDESDEPEPETEDASAGGVNRYLLVMTQVDETKFPAPDLKQRPDTLEELEAMLFPVVEKPAEVTAPDEGDEAAADEGDEAAADEGDEAAADEGEETAADEGEEATADEGEEATADEGEEATADEGEEATADEGEEATADEGEEAAADEGEEAAADEGDEAATDEGEEAATDEGEEAAADEGDEAATDDGEEAATDDGEEAATDDGEEAATDEGEEAAADEGDEAAADEPEVSPEEQARAEWDKLTAEEKQERLEAEQEKITKENQRKMDERKDKLEAAKRRVSELNERFADWYYVIAEDTYTKLRIKREELFAAPDAPAPPAGMQLPGQGGPSFLPNFPGAPGN